MTKTVLLGVSGGVAAYKACEIASGLSKLGYDVRPALTRNAREFVGVRALEALTGNRAVCEMFGDPAGAPGPEHITLAKSADAFVVAPATADIIAKFAHGICDDLLTSAFCAAVCKKALCPSMNSDMYGSPANLENIAILKSRGVEFIGPDVGRLACGAIGAGRMSEPREIVERVDEMLTPNPDYRGRRVLVTAGGTREFVDAVRYVGNRSSGRMGIAVAEAVCARGGAATLVAGAVSVPVGAEFRRIDVETTEEMRAAVMAEQKDCDAFVMAGAPADYAVANRAPGKLKGDRIVLELSKTPDIAQALGEIKGARPLVVFAAETSDLERNALLKLEKKRADIVVANDVSLPGAGFDSETNVATLFFRDGRRVDCPLMPKRDLADRILDGINDLQRSGRSQQQ